MDRSTADIEILLPYQKRWIEDKSVLKIGEKSRRCGLSWAEALGSSLDAMETDGQSTYYLSYNKDMTRQFIQDVAFWVKWLNLAAGEMEEEVIRDEDKDVSVFRIRFASGFVVEALPSKAYALRSKQGRIVLDEAAFTDDFEEILKAGLALLIWGGSFTILSSHNGDENPFNTLIKNIRSGKDEGWSLHRITFRDAVDQGLYKRICLVNKKAWTEEGQNEWVEKIRTTYKDNVEEELDVIPRRAGTKYFPRAMLDTCVARDIDIVRLNCKDDFSWAPVSRRERDVRKWFLTDVAPLLRSIERPIFVGQDFARSGDLSFLWIAEEATKKDLATRLLLELRNVPYDQQWQIIQLIAETVKSFGGIAIDGRGNGQALAEIATQQFPGAAECVMISRSWYAEWFPKLKGRIESREFCLPDDEFVLADFGVVTIKNGVPLITDRSADRPGMEGGPTGQRHGDGAVAALLCLYAWNECAADPAPVVAVGGFRRSNLFSGY